MIIYHYYWHPRVEPIQRILEEFTIIKIFNLKVYSTFPQLQVG